MRSSRVLPYVGGAQETNPQGLIVGLEKIGKHFQTFLSRAQSYQSPPLCHPALCPVSSSYKWRFLFPSGFGGASPEPLPSESTPRSQSKGRTAPASFGRVG